MLICKLYFYLGGAWVDVSTDATAQGVSYDGGIKTNRETDRVARPGSLSFVLKNNTGKYTPGHANAHADWNKGTPVKVEFSKDYKTKVKFIGRVNSIKLNYAYNNNRASITALDWMYFASQLPLDIPALQENQKANQIVSTILGFSPIQPTATSLQTGVATFPYAFHDNTVKTTAYSEITKAVLSEWGYSYVKQDGTLVLEAYNGRAATQKTVDITDDLGGFLLQANGDFLLQANGDKILLSNYDVTTVDAEATIMGDVEVEYGERIINRVVAQVYPYKEGETEQLLYTNETNQLIPAGGTVSFRVQFTDESSRQPISALPPSIKQYTLVHFDSPDDGISGVVDSAEPKIAGTTTAFTLASGATWYTNIKKFGTASVGFNGSSDYAYSNTQEKFNPRGLDFTIDYWEYRLASTSGKAIISRDTTGGFAPYVLGLSDGTTNKCYITSNGSSFDIANGQSMGTIALNQWVHYAITRSGNTFRTFKNGVQQATWTSSAVILPSTAAFSIARYGSAYYYGYIDELRIIKGYAAYTADFTPAVRQHDLSGVNWSVYTTPPKAGTEITNDITVTIGAGGAGLDITAVSASGSDGYLNIDIYGAPLQSLSPISSVAEDTTSVNTYGYFGENIDMRLRQDVVFAETVGSAIVATEKAPRFVLNKVSLVANKNNTNEALFLDCDMGDLVSINDPLSGYDALNHIQGVSWRAVPGDGNTVVFFDWIVKEQ